MPSLMLRARSTGHVDYRNHARTSWPPRRIRSLRWSLGESTDTFGRRFRRSGRTVEDWEQGRRRPDVLALLAMESVAYPEGRSRHDYVRFRPVWGGDYRAAALIIGSTRLTIDIYLPSQHTGPADTALDAIAEDDDDEVIVGTVTILTGPARGRNGVILLHGAAYGDGQTSIAGRIEEPSR